MKQWMNRLITLIGVLLIILAIYLFSKPYIDNYLHEKDNDHKIENYDKKEKEQTKTSKSTPKIPSDKSKMAGYIEVPDAQIKEPVYPGPATPEQLNRGKVLQKVMNLLINRIFQLLVIRLQIVRTINLQI